MRFKFRRWDLMFSGRDSCTAVLALKYSSKTDTRVYLTSTSYNWQQVRTVHPLGRRPGDVHAQTGPRFTRQERRGEKPTDRCSTYQTKRISRPRVNNRTDINPIRTVTLFHSAGGNRRFAPIQLGPIVVHPAHRAHAIKVSALRGEDGKRAVRAAADVYTGMLHRCAST